MSYKTKFKKYFDLKLIIPLILVVFILSLSSAFVFINKSKGDLHNSTGEKTSQFGEFKTYTSQNLGISFVYSSGSEAQPVLVKEIENRIYLYGKFGNYVQRPEEGKFVEVFSKDSNQSLVEAIREKFLKGYSPSDCLITPPVFARGKSNPALEYMQITTPKLSASEYSVRRQLDDAAKCPSTYTTSRLTGMSYFMMDPKHSDKFVYFKLGTDNFLAAPWTGTGVAYTWDMSLTFTK